MNTNTKTFSLRIHPKILEFAKRPEDIAVLVAMFGFSDNGLGQCYASHRTISLKAHVSDKTVPIAIKRTAIFEKTGEKIVQGGTVNVYEVRKSVAPFILKPSEVRKSVALIDRSAEVRSAEAGTKCGRVTDNTLIPIREEKKKDFLHVDKTTMEEISKQLSVSKKTVEYEYQKMVDWLKSKGQTRKDYKATLRNWLRRGIEGGSIKTIKSFEEQVREDNPDIKII